MGSQRLQTWLSDFHFTSNQSILKEINLEYSLEALMLKLQYFGHLMQRAYSWEKTLMLGKIEDRKGATEDEMVGWHRWLNGHEFEQTPGDGEGQGSLACCSPWGRKESDMNEWLKNNQLCSPAQVSTPPVRPHRVQSAARTRAPCVPSAQSLPSSFPLPRMSSPICPNPLPLSGTPQVSAPPGSLLQPHDVLLMPCSPELKYLSMVDTACQVQPKLLTHRLISCTQAVALSCYILGWFLCKC